MILLLWFLAQSPDDAARQAAARALLAKFTAGQYTEMQEDFDARMREALPPAKVAAFAAQFAQVGKFQSVREVRQSTEQGYRVVTLVSQYELALIDVRVVFDADGKVAGLLFRPSNAAPRVAAPTRFADY